MPFSAGVYRLTAVPTSSILTSVTIVLCKHSAYHCSTRRNRTMVIPTVVGMEITYQSGGCAQSAGNHLYTHVVSIPYQMRPNTSRRGSTRRHHIWCRLVRNAGEVRLTRDPRSGMISP